MVLFVIINDHNIITMRVYLSPINLPLISPVNIETSGNVEKLGFSFARAIKSDGT